MSAKKLEQMRMEEWQRNIIERLTRLEDARIATSTEKPFTREEVRWLLVTAAQNGNLHGCDMAYGEIADAVLREAGR